MARERAFSEEQVQSAAEALLIEGKNINGTSLRNKVGSGRPSALMEAYQALKESGVIQMPTRPGIEDAPRQPQMLPPEVAEAMNVILADVEALLRRNYDVAHQTVEQRLNGAIAEANQCAKEAALREAESVAEQDKAFEELEDTLEKLAELQDTALRQQHDIQQLNADLSLSRSETKAALISVDERDKRLQTMEAQLSNLQQAMSKAASDQAKALGQVESLTQQLATQTTELKAVNKTNSQLEKDLVKAQSSSLSLTDKLASESNKCERLRAALQTCEQKLAAEASQYQSQLNEQAAELKALNKEITQQQSARVQAESYTRSLTEKLSHSETERKQLTRSLASTTQALNDAQQQCARLEGQLQGLSHAAPKEDAQDE